MRKIASVLIVLLIPLALSTSTVRMVHATTMTGTFKLGWTMLRSKALANGTLVTYAKDSTVYQGVFSGSSNATETDYNHPDDSGSLHEVESFIGSFNGSQQGALTFQDFGYYLATNAGYWAASFGNGTGGLAGLQGTLTGQYPGTVCNGMGTFCSMQGTYTVITASWGNKPAPEFSMVTLLTVTTLILPLGIVRKRRLKSQ